MYWKYQLGLPAASQGSRSIDGRLRKYSCSQGCVVTMLWLKIFALLTFVMITASTSIDLSACGTSKGCLTFPVGCTGAKCTKMATWTTGTGDTIEFELQTREDGANWAALGLSKSGGMDDASVLACVNGVKTEVRQYYNNGYTPTSLGDPNLGLTVIETSSTGADGVYCKFSRALTVNGDPQAFPLDAEYKLIMASGPVDAGVIKYHAGFAAGVSDAQVNVATSRDWIGGSPDKKILKKAHGSLMIAAWVVTAALGILSARYMKTAWPDSTIADLAVWFQIHRFCMVLTLLMNTIAFVIIFVDVKGWSKIEGTDNFQKAHPIIGVVISVLTVLNPIMALFRPGPTDSKRPMFNWFHWAVGSAAFVLAMINIYLGMLLPSSNFVSITARYLLIAFFALYTLTQIFLEINKCCGNRSSKASDDAIEMQGPGTNIVKQKNTNLTARYCIMVFYLLGTIGLFIGMVVLMIV
ncbi:hypothetical protein CAPTEDRAFT_221980 [Capitella teleta]|uniref:Cytochrome b561 domain-containing protein n=1 Tax=Capitella teleta TaxID=283909 RepID=R7UPN4_CAPTE|nr:hypothetical protein CAPTEDRAFT_221980 [Capitella teleta]|eukprot:ELU05912.1 hypothetical protein CAPTEDRAFT_221980 [Capitella teleta]